MLKRAFTEQEKFGLSPDEERMALRYMRKHKTFGAIRPPESLKLYEMYLLGCTFADIQKQFPQYDLEKIIMTAALNKWGMEREKVQYSLKDRVRAKVIRSVIDQVDFLTTMLTVSNTEHIEKMRKYIMDPVNNPAPDMKIRSIKDYKEVAESLYKIVQGTAPGNGKPSPMLEALNTDLKLPDPNRKKITEKEDDVLDLAELTKAEDGEED
jgi:hypothetical protein